MTQSIITRYLGQTSTKPARMSVTSSSKARIFHVPGASHLEAAHKLAKCLKWPGRWQGAALNDKGDMVWVNTSDNFAPNYRFEV